MFTAEKIGARSIEANRGQLGQRGLRFEPLESRRVLSVNVALDGDVLAIYGTDNADRMDVAVFGEDLIVQVNDVRLVYSSDNVKHIRAFGNQGNDSIRIRASVVQTTELAGGLGNDTIYGGPQADTIDGGAGHDRLHGGLGDDTVQGGTGNDAIFGDAGNDTLTGDLDLTIDGADVSQVETLLSGNDWIFGGTGDDVLRGMAGDDVLQGGLGHDQLDGGLGNDVLGGGLGDDILSGGSGGDWLAGDGGDDQLHGGAGNDVLLGGGGADQLLGDAGNDALTGGLGKDDLDGGDGRDAVFAFDRYADHIRTDGLDFLSIDARDTVEQENDLSAN